MHLAESPIGLSLIICDTIIEDVHTHKRSLIGLFNNVTADSFPYTLPLCHLMVSMTGCVGRFDCFITCENSETGEQILQIPCPISPHTPLDVVEMCVVLKKLVFPVPGRYSMKVLCDGIPVMIRPIGVTLKKKPIIPPPPTDKQGL